MKRSARRVIVVGGGPGGLTAAIALRSAGMLPTVLERRDDPFSAGSALTLWPNAMAALEALGAAGAVRAASRPSEGIAMRSWTGGRLFDVERGRMLADVFGISGAAVHRRELLEVLAGMLEGGELRTGVRCTGWEQDAEGVTVRCDDGSELRGEALVGADGIRSAVRGRLFGGAELRYAGFTVWRGVCRHRLPGDVGVTTLGRGAQFGYFPMTRDRVYWFASANAPEGAPDAPAGRRAELKERFGAWHPPIPALVEATADEAVLRSDIHDLDPLPRWSEGRVTLLGDAAHPSTPNLGQGACQAIEDAVVLARCLAEHAQVPAALRAYEAARIPRAGAMTLQARRIAQAGQWESPLACWLRDRMVRATPEALRLRHLRWMFAGPA